MKNQLINGWLSSTHIISLPRLPSLSSAYTILLFPFPVARLLLSAAVRLHKHARIVDFGWILAYVALLLPRYVIVVTLASSSFSLHFHSIFIIFFVFFCVWFFSFLFFSSIARWQRSSFISEQTYWMSLVSHVIVHAMPSLSRIFSLDSLCVSLVFFLMFATVFFRAHLWSRVLLFLLLFSV